MAGSRLDRIGNLFSRATGLLRTGAVKYEDRPIWFDVYRVFPPKYEPRFNREVEDQGDIRPIFYKEDAIRADFQKRFGHNPGGIVRDLKAIGEDDIIHKFIDDYNQVQKRNLDWTHEQIFENVAQSFGSSLRHKSIDGQEQETRKISQRRINRRTNIVTSETLLSMFKESTEEESNNKNNDNKSSKTTQKNQNKSHTSGRIDNSRSSD